MINLQQSFKMYYIDFHTTNKTKNYRQYENLNINRGELLENIKNSNDITSIIAYFEKSMYLDLWVDICDKEKEFFLNKAKSMQKAIEKRIAKEMHYFSNENIITFIESDLGDFENIIDFETNNITGRKVTNTKIAKVLFKIIQKLDIVTFDKMVLNISKEISIISTNKPVSSFLWNSVSIQEDGKVILNKTLDTIISYIKENNLLKNEECKIFYQYLKMANINGIENMGSLLINA